MRSWLFACAVLAWAVAAHAQDGPPLPAAGASPTLEAVMAQLAASPGLKARFVELRNVVLLEEPVETRGRIALVPPDRFARITDTPSQTRLVLEAGELRFEHEGQPSDDAVEHAMARRFAEELLLLLRGDLPAIRDRYQIDFLQQGEGWQLGLVPRSAQARRFVDRLILRGVGGGIASLELQEPSGVGAITRFSEVAMDRPLAPEDLSVFFGRPLQP